MAAKWRVALLSLGIAVVLGACGYSTVESYCDGPNKVYVASAPRSTSVDVVPDGCIEKEGK